MGQQKLQRQKWRGSSTFANEAFRGKQLWELALRLWAQLLPHAKADPFPWQIPTVDLGGYIEISDELCPGISVKWLWESPLNHNRLTSVLQQRFILTCQSHKVVRQVALPLWGGGAQLSGLRHGFLAVALLYQGQLPEGCSLCLTCPRQPRWSLLLTGFFALATLQNHLWKCWNIPVCWATLKAN